ncbi:hypothetical protein [Mesoterricola silvestris]|nr:hypothetical protein [Mesoterricola silvestris]
MAFNEEFAKQIIGHTVVVGFNHATSDGDLIRKSQDFGTITSVSAEDGIEITRPDGSSFTVPPDFRSMKVADPGIYTLRSNQASIENPSYTMIWTIYGADSDAPTWTPIK